MEELEDKVTKSIIENRPLKIKLGLDPSAPDVHIGHTVVLNKIRQFQDNGHTIQLIIGDFTGKIGDPTGKSVARKQLTDEEVKHNAKTYFEQFGKIVDLNMLNSKSEARRMIENRGVRINGEKIENPQLQISVVNDLIIQVGKRKFIKVKI